MDWRPRDTTIRLGEGETAVVGFGLLLARSTVDQTLGYSYDGAFVRGHLDGSRRSWGVSMPNAAYYHEDGGRRLYPDRIVYLDLERTPGSLMNCVVIVLGPTDPAPK